MAIIDDRQPRTENRDSDNRQPTTDNRQPSNAKEGAGALTPYNPAVSLGRARTTIKILARAVSCCVWRKISASPPSF